MKGLSLFPRARTETRICPQKRKAEEMEGGDALEKEVEEEAEQPPSKKKKKKAEEVEEEVEEPKSGKKKGRIELMFANLCSLKF